MSRIHGKNTWLELAVRKLFSENDIYYRLQRIVSMEEQGRVVRIRPDLQNKSRGWTVFANGCFWHLHPECRDANMPKGGEIDWPAKLIATRERDARNYRLLLEAGWKVLVIWECGMKHCKNDQGRLIEFINEGKGFYEWPEKPPRVRKTHEFV